MNDPRGSQWRKWDLHFHTPMSHDHGNKGMSAEDIVERLLQANIEVVAVTDHHILHVEFIEQMRKVAGDKLTVLPGIEVASDYGAVEGVHFIGLFPEDSDLADLERELLTRLDINKKLKNGVDPKCLYVEFPAAAVLMQSLGGIITVHGHGKAAKIETISSKLKFKQELKTDLLRDYVDIIEVGSAKDTEPYKGIVFPKIGFKRPLIVGSDDHANDRYHADKRYPIEKCCWIKADPTFLGLRMALREPEHRFCLDEVPPDIHRVETNKTKYIKSVSLQKLSSMPTGEEWLQGEVQLNAGLVAVIGNKGSGKSALTDCIGLLGSCATSRAFSFLHILRFRHPKTGQAEHVKATMVWHDGDPVARKLDDEVSQDEPERVKYLPQSFVESVCNDLATPHGGEFEKELKKVVFSKVAPEDRLGQRTLDKLVEYRTKELHQEAKGLTQELLGLGEERAQFEERLDPAVRTGLEKKIERKKDEIRSHEATKPDEVKAPSKDPNPDSEAVKSIRELEQIKVKREKIISDIAIQEEIVQKQQLRASTAQKLLSKLDNLKSSVERAINDLLTEAEILDLKREDLVSLTVVPDPVTYILKDATTKRNSARGVIGSTESESPTGLIQERIECDSRIKELQDTLSRPQQEYHSYLEAMKKWEETMKALKGSNDIPQSLAGLEADLKALDNVPEQIKQIEQNQERIAKTIHELSVKAVAIYTELYDPVQKFITQHPLASDHLKLEFKVELVEDGFTDRLLQCINQNRVGTFYGVEDGQRIARELVSRVDWADWESVKCFLESVVNHLHHDKRTKKGEEPISLASQIAKGWTVAQLYHWLYGLTYVTPRYLLRWDGKDVEQLSPGERGTLLLIFYLLVDNSDLPLIIDQPEANLDNVTVAEKLVHCIRDARNRRQVIIVTHNPNLAVVCDADQIIYASLDKPAGNRITYQTGGLEHPIINRFTINVLEGGRDPFDIRDNTYQVAGE